MGITERGRALAVLGRWLGPWARGDAAPADVRTSDLAIGEGLRGRTYAPSRRAASGSLLLVPGLHFAGPDDVRMDRFARILASAGYLVLAPFLRDFLELRLTPRLHADTERAFDALLALPQRPRGRPAVFSISFGSLLALHLAARGARRAELGGVIVFGGYVDPGEALRFSLTGEAPGAGTLPRDPLNQPVVFINLLDELGVAPADQPALHGAWLDYCRAVWGRPEMKVAGRHVPVAHRIAAEACLDDAQRTLFLQGTGAAPGGPERAGAALARAGERLAQLDPRPLLDAITVPVTLFHGADDDVIPWTHAGRLAAAMPARTRARALVTGLYGHTGSATIRETFSRVPSVARELATMLRMLTALVDAGMG